MSTNNIRKSSVLRKRQPRVVAVDYKQYCRYVWIRRQRGKRRHEHANKD